MRDRDCVTFLQWALPRLRMRWPGFRKVRGQVCKRITRRMAALEVDGVPGYEAYLEGHPEEWEVLDALCRVTVSRFLRDRGVWSLIQGEVLDTLARAAREEDREAIRCWSAGCGSGEEPYSLSLVWRLGPLPPPEGETEESPGKAQGSARHAEEAARRAEDSTGNADECAGACSLASRYRDVEMLVTATDAEPEVLRRARRATYEPGTLKELPTCWIEEAFGAPDGGSESSVTLRPELRKGVSFLPSDIRTSTPQGPFGFILCRNLAFTYFREPLQQEVLGRLLGRLRPGGYLALGAHEELPRGDWPLGRVKKGTPLYRHMPHAGG